MNRFDRFAALWGRHETSNADSRVRNVYDDLISMYEEPWRTYHNFDHISSCLGWFDLCKAHAEDPDAIEMAIWFHDCIYTVGASDNEARSRDLFLERSDGELEDGFRNRVARLIMDTCHRNKPESPDGQLLADIDLTNFGLHWNEYIANSSNVRQEIENSKQFPSSSFRPVHSWNFCSREKTSITHHTTASIMKRRPGKTSRSISPYGPKTADRFKPNEMEMFQWDACRQTENSQVRYRFRPVRGTSAWSHGITNPFRF